MSGGQVKLSQLPAITTVLAESTLPLVQSGVTSKVTATNLGAYMADYVTANIGPLTKTLNLSDLTNVPNARTNLGLGTIATQAASAVAITGGSITGITDLTIADGGTGASTAAGARTNLGLVIGTDVQAYNANLTTYATVAPTAAGLALLDDVDASAQRTTLGLGTIATQAASSVSITGGSITGITDLAIADGGTGASTAAAARTALGTDLAENVTFTPSGTGAANETVQAMGRRVVWSDQYSTVQQAITAAGSGGTVVFPRGGTTTLTSALSLSGLSNVTLIGYGHTMRSGATRIASYIDCSGASNVLIEGFIFDSRQGDMPVYTEADFALNNTTYNTPVVCNGSVSAWSGVTIKNCSFTALYTNGVWAYQGSNLTIENCAFAAPVCNQTFNGTLGCQQYSFVYLQTCTGAISVNGNRFIGSTTTNPALPPNAVFMSGFSSGKASIYGNYSTYCGRNNTGDHRLAVYDLYGDVKHVHIYDNTADNTLGAFCRITAAEHCTLDGNVANFNANTDNTEYAVAVYGTISFGGIKGCSNIRVTNNTFNDDSNRHVSTIAVNAYDYGYPSTRIRIVGNTFNGGVTSVSLAGPFYDFALENNIFNGDVSALHVIPAPSGVTLTTTYGTEANSSYDQCFVRGNRFRNSNAASGKNPFNFALNTATTSRVGYFEISGNYLRSASTTGFGIILQHYSSATSNTLTVVRNNVTLGFSYGVYFRDMGELIYENNRHKDWATAAILDDVGYTVIHRTGNRLSSTGSLIGSSTLVSGTVTVANTEVRTGDRIRVTRTSAGGTTGTSLVIGTITNATSFVINAVDTSGATVTTDTSTVLWEIIH